MANLQKIIDNSFAVSRLFRLTSLDLCAMAFLIIEVAISSYWHRSTNPQTLALPELLGPSCTNESLTRHCHCLPFSR